MTLGSSGLLVLPVHARVNSTQVSRVIALSPPGCWTEKRSKISATTFFALGVSSGYDVTGLSSTTRALRYKWVLFLKAPRFSLGLNLSSPSVVP